MKEQDKAYMVKDAPEVHDLNPYDDVYGTFKALIVVLAVCIAVTLLSYVLWGKV
jgi:hypothetical protein